MDVFDEEVLTLWKALHNAGVKYLMVGGFATNLHGYQRYTGDVDVWLHDTPENRANFRNALKQARIGDYPMIERMQFVAGWTQFRLPSGMPLDVMTTMKGLEQYSFDECLSVATWATIAECSVPFLHINQLIANKKITNRPQDQLDVLQLEKIKALRESEVSGAAPQ